MPLRCTVNGRYCYGYDNFPDLSVGDVVQLPPSWAGGCWEGKVTALVGTTGYTGPVKQILGFYRPEEGVRCQA